MSKESNELEELNKQIEGEPDKEKKAWLEYIRDFALGKKSKNERVLEEVKKVDKHIKTALTIVLNYYAESEGQFNQKHLEDFATLVVKRSKLVRNLK